MTCTPSSVRLVPHLVSPPSHRSHAPHSPELLGILHCQMARGLGRTTEDLLLLDASDIQLLVDRPLHCNHLCPLIYSNCLLLIGKAPPFLLCKPPPILRLDLQHLLLTPLPCDFDLLPPH